MEGVSELSRHRCLSLLVLGKAVYIQRFQGSYWSSMSDSLHLEYRDSMQTAEPFTVKTAACSVPLFLILISILILVQMAFVKKTENVLKKTWIPFLMGLSQHFLAIKQCSPIQKGTTRRPTKIKNAIICCRRNVSFEHYQSTEQTSIGESGKK